MVVTNPTALTHMALGFAQSAAFLIPEEAAAVKVATAVVGTDTLIGIFFPDDQPPPPATSAEVQAGFAELANVVKQTAWTLKLLDKINDITDATTFHKEAMDDFNANRFGTTPIKKLSKTLSQDWARVYDAVKAYADQATDQGKPSTLLAVRNWITDEAYADSQHVDVPDQPGNEKWVKFELLPLYCSAVAVYVSFCKLALMLEFRDGMSGKLAKLDDNQRRLAPEDFMELAASPYFHNVEAVVLGDVDKNGDYVGNGAIDYLKDAAAEYQASIKKLAADKTWRENQVSITPAGAKPGDMVRVYDAEADWTSAPMDYMAGQVQLAMRQAAAAAPYVEGKAAEYGIGALRQADIDELVKLYLDTSASAAKDDTKEPWDKLRRDIIKAKKKWAAFQASTAGGGKGTGG